VGRAGHGTEWISGDPDTPADEVIEHFTALFTAAAHATVRAVLIGPMLVID
jgi:hypothetical protein